MRSRTVTQELQDTLGGEWEHGRDPDTGCHQWLRTDTDDGTYALRHGDVIKVFHPVEETVQSFHCYAGRHR